MDPGVSILYEDVDIHSFFFFAIEGIQSAACMAEWPTGDGRILWKENPEVILAEQQAMFSVKWNLFRIKNISCFTDDLNSRWGR